MLKVGDNVVSLNDLKILASIVVKKGTKGRVKEAGLFYSLVRWKEGKTDPFGKVEWWIDNSDIELI